MATADPRCGDIAFQPITDLPTPPEYNVLRTPTAPPLHADPRTDTIWDRAAWSQPLQDILGTVRNAPPYGNTCFKALWDAQTIYFSAWLPEHHLVATIEQRNAKMFHDNDFEIFLDPDCDGENYFEFEVNALGTTWQLSLDRPYLLGGVPRDPHELPGLRSAVRIFGKLNDPSVLDEGWAVNVAIPLSQLRQFGAAVPLCAGMRWRANFSRVQWDYDVCVGKYVRRPPVGTPLPQGADEWHPEKNFVWAPTGVIDIHRPQHWGTLVFRD